MNDHDDDDDVGVDLGVAELEASLTFAAKLGILADFDGNDSALLAWWRQAPQQLRDRLATDDEGPSDRLQERWKSLREYGRWLHEDPPPRSSVLLTRAGYSFLPRGKVGVLAAAGGVGKTLTLTQLALVVALPPKAHEAMPGLGLFAGMRERGNSVSLSFSPVEGAYRVDPDAAGQQVLLVLGEETSDEVHRRLHLAARQLRLTGGGVHPEMVPEWLDHAYDALSIVPGAGLHSLGLIDDDANFQPSDTANKIHERLQLTGQERPWSLLIFDPMSRFAGAETEKDNRSATALIQTLERMAEVPGTPAVVLAHHTHQDERLQKIGPKELRTPSSTTVARGVTALSDGVRWQAVMKPCQYAPGAPFVIRFSVPKNSYGPQPDPLPLVRGIGGMPRVACGDEVEKWEAACSTKPKAKPKPNDETALDIISMP